MTILLGGLFFLITVVTGEVITLNNGVLDSFVRYDSHPAAFGTNFSSEEMFKANLFLAPSSDRELCKTRNNLRLDRRGLELSDDLGESMNIYERDSWNNETVQLYLDTFRTDIALLVRRGKCSFATKARNAQRLNMMYDNIFSGDPYGRVKGRIKYMIVYNNDPRYNFRDTLLIMHSEEEVDDIDLGLLFVSLTTGSFLLSQINTASQKLDELGVTGSGARYFDIGYDTDFTFPIYLNGKIPYVQPTEVPNQRALVSFYDGLRFILIALLVIIPLCRTIFLWFKGGGRIKWRRDPETNRINGILIIQPRNRWLCDYHRRRPIWNPAADDQNTDDQDLERDTQRKLTKEQVLALPEIEFKGENQKDQIKEENNSLPETASTSPTSSSSSSNENKKDNFIINQDELKIIDKPEKASEDDKKQAAAPDVPISTDKDSKQSSSNKKLEPKPMDDESQKIQDELKTCHACDRVEEKSCASNNETKNNIYKISSSVNVCSICIEDFEPGEKLRLLPLCGHVFHTEWCVMLKFVYINH